MDRRKHILHILTITLCASFCYGGTLTEILSHYDTLNRVDIQHRIVRRDLTQPPQRNVEFTSHGKKFRMHLEQSRDFLDPSFIAVTIGEDGIERPVKINLDSFYDGYVEGDVTSHVTAHIEDNGMVTASVDTANESYIIEPMWRHVDKDPSHDMIVYKASDVKWNLTIPYDPKTREAHVNTCGNKDTAPEEVEEDEKSKRSRRNTNCAQVTGPNTCSLHLVGDYNFVKEIGRGDRTTAIYYMLQVVKRVDKIYRETCWNGVGTNIGVQVKKVTTHESFSTSNNRYNSKVNGGWNVDRLLTEFSRKDHRDFCLAHLFTYQDFHQGVIGLAYVASRGSRIGGICSTPSNDRIGGRFHNCGLTTYINWGRKLTTLEATLVTVHEIGHNFGSNHDPRRCAAQSPDGRYVMYATSVTGEKTNNQKFSFCSKSQIGGVLKSRMSCLKAPSALCGNGFVEDGENCDAGHQDTKCCDKKTCKFTAGSVCSDINSRCCTNCQVSSATKECKPAFALECKGITFCNGSSATCPGIEPKLTSGVCNIKSNFRRGNCTTNGVCKSLCELKGLKECSCPAGPSACKVCCTRDVASNCKPLPEDSVENDGVQCAASSSEEGLCDTGKCQKLQRSVKESFKNLLTDFTLDKAVRFMQNNIVLTILFFSLLLWIPAGCIVNQIDRSEERKAIEKETLRDELVIMKGSFKKKKNFDGVHVRSGQHVGT